MTTASTGGEGGEEELISHAACNINTNAWPGPQDFVIPQRVRANVERSDSETLGETRYRLNGVVCKEMAARDFRAARRDVQQEREERENQFFYFRYLSIRIGQVCERAFQSLFWDPSC